MSAALAATSVATGVTAATLDEGACLEHDRAACAGAALGLIGAAAAAAPDALAQLGVIGEDPAYGSAARWGWFVGGGDNLGLGLWKPVSTPSSLRRDRTSLRLMPNRREPSVQCAHSLGFINRTLCGYFVTRGFRGGRDVPRLLRRYGAEATALILCARAYTLYALAVGLIGTVLLRVFSPAALVCYIAAALFIVSTVLCLIVGPLRVAPQHPIGEDTSP
jgi:hypothetical protein